MVQLIAISLYVMVLGKLFTHVSLCKECNLVPAKAGEKAHHTVALWLWSCNFTQWLADGYRNVNEHRPVADVSRRLTQCYYNVINLSARLLTDHLKTVKFQTWLFYNSCFTHSHFNNISCILPDKSVVVYKMEASTSTNVYFWKHGFPCCNHVHASRHGL